MNRIHLEMISDRQLLNELRTAAACERKATAHLVALLAEMDVRKLYLAEGYSSLFTYCTQCLHLSEHAAYGRIQAARAARRFPKIIELLQDGSVTLTTVSLLASHVTDENCSEVLGAARHKSKREVEQQVAALAPKPDVPPRVQKLPATATTGGQKLVEDAIPSLPAVANAVVERRVAAQRDRSRSVIAPVAPERYRFQITISRETHDRLRRVQDLLRHVVPNGDPAVIFDRALTLLLEDLEKRKLAKADHPHARVAPEGKGRHIPAAVRREVWARDQGRCAFLGTDGRCGETGFLEFHHVIPFAEGGATSVQNLQLRCRAHNVYEAREHFGNLLFRECSWELGPDRVDVWHHSCASGEPVSRPVGDRTDLHGLRTASDTASAGDWQPETGNLYFRSTTAYVPIFGSENSIAPSAAT